MRDHRLALLALRPFIRWKATSLARFSFDRPHDSAETAHVAPPSLTISPPRNFGVEIQMNVAAPPPGSAEPGRDGAYGTPYILHPQKLNPKPYTLNPKRTIKHTPSTIHHQPSKLNPKRILNHTP